MVLISYRIGALAFAALTSGLLLSSCTEPAVEPLPPEQTINIDPNPDTLEAPWNLAGPVETVTGQGDTLLTDVPAGIYRITWQPVTDWNLPSPASQETTLIEGGDLTFSGNYTLIRPPADFVLVTIPGGTFTMGAPAGELGSSDAERPQHEVTITSFLMSVTEVTQNQWLNVRASEPAWFTGCDDCPVERVTWLDAVNFCNALSDVQGLNRAYNIVGPAVIWDPAADGYRLPTEAEWEYACRAGATTALANGDLSVVACNADPNLSNLGWYCSNANSNTSETGQKATNDFGLYDMHGNVWEWVWDWYGAYSAAPSTDPIGPDTGLFKVIRGGGWLYGAQRCRSAHRRPAAPGSVSSDLGFRIVRNDTISTTIPTDRRVDRKSMIPSGSEADHTISQPGGRP
jgi:formylglycine-generating enzyme required for sulfatase activity